MCNVQTTTGRTHGTLLALLLLVHGGECCEGLLKAGLPWRAYAVRKSGGRVGQDTTESRKLGIDLSKQQQ